MAFVLESQDGALVVAVSGQLVVTNRQELKQLVLDELERGARLFVIDFSDTSYIDSSGLGALVSLKKRIEEVGGELRISSMNEDVRTLFELTRLDTLFHLYPSRQDAVRGVA